MATLTYQDKKRERFLERAFIYSYRSALDKRPPEVVRERKEERINA